MSSTAVLSTLMACAAVTFGTAIGWVLAYAAAPLADRARWSARSRATLLAQLRLLPLACPVVLVLAEVQAFVRFETTRAESAGPLLITLALAGAMLAIDAMWRGARAWRDTLAWMATWRATATPILLANWRGPAWAIRPAFPIVAVVGAFRPQLFIARQVIDHCTSEELRAIAAHEAAHVAARDNLIRLLFAVTPGARTMPRLAASIERRWLAAAEEAADTHASGESGHLELASALTKVARLAIVTTPQPLAASAFINMPDLDARVRRLVDPPTPARLRRAAWLPTLVLLGAAAASQVPVVSAALHDAFEMLVRSH